MSTLEKMKAAIIEYNVIVENARNPYVDDVNNRLESLMKKNEDCTRQFLAECSPEDFEIACFGIFECALKWKLPFVEYTEELAEEKGWTDYTRRMIDEARLEVE
jgi:hypothetical protein